MSRSHDPVLRKLTWLRRRILVQEFLEKVVWVTLVFAGALVAKGAVNRWLLERMPWEAALAGAAGILAALVALGWTLAGRAEPRRVAQMIDRRGQTSDRFLSALTFAQKGAAPGMTELARRECEAYVAGRDFREVALVRMPREVAWLLVPAAALAMLQWEARAAFAGRDAALAEGRAEVAPTAEKLEQMARAVERKAEVADDAELRKLAEKLKQSAAQLRAEATGKEEGEKAVLSRLSELEQLVREMQKTPAKATPEELKQLAAELEKHVATKDVASAMQAGKMADAAQELEEAAKREQPSAENAQEALKQALERLAEQRQLSEALQKLAQQMQKDGGGGPQSSELLKKLAQLLRELPEGPGGAKPQPGKISTPQSLQELLAALQNLKYGEKNEGAGKPTPGDGGGKGQLTTQSFSAPKPGEQPQDGLAQLPTGSPGGEHDTGTGDPLGDKPGALGGKGAELALKGTLGEGESLSLSMPAGADQARSSRRYKELYEAMAPAAQDAVMQEEIPLGSRFFIKRYFEAIRPE